MSSSPTRSLRTVTALRWMRPIVGALALAAAAGCSGTNESTDEGDEAAVTAAEANAQGYAFKEHVLVDVPAGAEAARALGIAKWNVFAGEHKESGFKGSVFYASDPQGDVKYVYSVDVASKRVAFLMLEKDGRAGQMPALTDVEYKHMLGDIDGLKAKLQTSDRISSCVVTVAAAAFTLVVGAGIVFAGGALGTAVAMSGGVASGLVAMLAETPILFYVASVTQWSFTAAATGTFAYAVWTAGEGVVTEVAGHATNCLTGAGAPGR